MAQGKRQTYSSSSGSHYQQKHHHSPIMGLYVLLRYIEHEVVLPKCHMYFYKVNDFALLPLFSDFDAD